MVCVTVHFCLLSLDQEGWTTVLVAARYGHRSLVQELCEAFRADILHRRKVRVMQTVVAVSGVDCIVHVPNHHVWLH